MRVVLDTNVVIRGLANPGSIAGKILQLCEQRTLVLLLSLPVLFLADIAAALVFAGFVAWGNMRLQRDSQRRAAGLCVRCGYDLRASSDRCPECGKVIGR